MGNADDRSHQEPLTGPERQRIAHAHPDVTEGDLRRLLAANVPSACLVLREGRIRLDAVAGEPDGLLVISRRELVSRLGNDPDPTELAQHATEVDVELRLPGA